MWVLLPATGLSGRELLSERSEDSSQTAEPQLMSVQESQLTVEHHLFGGTLPV